MDQFNSHQSKLGFRVFTGTQTVTSKGSPGSPVDSKRVNASTVWKRELRSIQWLLIKIFSRLAIVIYYIRVHSPRVHHGERWLVAWVVITRCTCSSSMLATDIHTCRHFLSNLAITEVSTVVSVGNRWGYLGRKRPMGSHHVSWWDRRGDSSVRSPLLLGYNGACTSWLVHRDVELLTPLRVLYGGIQPTAAPERPAIAYDYYSNRMTSPLRIPSSMCVYLDYGYKDGWFSSPLPLWHS